MNSELRAITVGRTDTDGSAGIGFDARRVLKQQQTTTFEDR